MEGKREAGASQGGRGECKEGASARSQEIADRWEKEAVDGDRPAAFTAARHGTTAATPALGGNEEHTSFTPSQGY